MCHTTLFRSNAWGESLVSLEAWHFMPRERRSRCPKQCLLSLVRLLFHARGHLALFSPIVH